MTENKLPNLLPCPFCGGEAIEVEPLADGYWRITCRDCCARMCGTHRRMNQEAWNTRHEPTWGEYEKLLDIVVDSYHKGFIDGAVKTYELVEHVGEQND